VLTTLSSWPITFFSNLNAFRLLDIKDYSYGQHTLKQQWFAASTDLFIGLWLLANDIVKLQPIHLLLSRQ